MGSMDTLWGLMGRLLFLLLMIILVSVAVAILAWFCWGGTASALVLLVGLIVVFFFLRPKSLGGLSRK